MHTLRGEQAFVGILAEVRKQVDGAASGVV